MTNYTLAVNFLSLSFKTSKLFWGYKWNYLFSDLTHSVSLSTKYKPFACRRRERISIRLKKRNIFLKKYIFPPHFIKSTPVIVVIVVMFVMCERDGGSVVSTVASQQAGQCLSVWCLHVSPKFVRVALDQNTGLELDMVPGLCTVAANCS